MLKAGVKLIEKTAVDAVKGIAGGDLGPVVEVLHGMLDEVERASKAASGAAAAGWILDLRGRIVDAYTQGQSGEDLRRQVEADYNRNDEGGRGGYIAGIQNELDALRQAQDLIPASNAIESAMYEAWIDGQFDNDCMEGTGLIELVFDQDGSAASAKVVGALGEQVGARLNSIMPDAGVTNLMDLDVVKRVCRDDQCMCFEGDNVVRADVLDEDMNSFLAAPDNWRAFVRFSG